MASRRCRRSTSPTAGPLEDDDLLAEILLRLPPKPSSLPRASLVCKRWRSVATDAAFRRRFRIRHRKPPILGVFECYDGKLVFTSVLEPPDRIPSKRFSLDLGADWRLPWDWDMLGCRHGRILLINRFRHLLLVFEPVSRDTLRIRIPQEFVRDGYTTATGAVLCAAGDEQDHVHGDCHMNPFKVVLVSPRSQEGPAIARVYSRETGMWMWGDLASTDEPFAGYVRLHHASLVGNALYCCLYGTTDAALNSILKFDLDNQSLTVIGTPPVVLDGSQSWIIQAEEGGLGIVILSYPSFQLWDRNVDCQGVATWVPRKTVNMYEMLGLKARDVRITGYAEDTNVILISMEKPSKIDRFRRGLTIVQLDSMKVKKCHGDFWTNFYYPLTNFYTAGTARA